MDGNPDGVMAMTLGGWKSAQLVEDGGISSSGMKNRSRTYCWWCSREGGGGEYPLRMGHWFERSFNHLYGELLIFVAINFLLVVNHPPGGEIFNINTPARFRLQTAIQWFRCAYCPARYSAPRSLCLICPPWHRWRALNDSRSYVLFAARPRQKHHPHHYRQRNVRWLNHEA